MLRAAMIPDAHLSGLDDPNQARLVALLDGLHLERLFLLGDLFHFWWGFEAVVYGEFVPVLAALHRLRQRGVAIAWVPGNHDFALGPFVTRDLGIEVAAQLRVRLGGLDFLLAHGDEADTSAGYRLTRAVLRGRPFGALMRLAGPERARRIGLSLAGSSQEHAAEPGPLVEAQRHWAAERLGEPGLDVVVVGHTHTPGVHQLPGGRLVNLGDFTHHFTWLAVTDDGLALREAPPI